MTAPGGVRDVPVVRRGPAGAHAPQDEPRGADGRLQALRRSWQAQLRERSARVVLTDGGDPRALQAAAALAAEGAVAPVIVGRRRLVEAAASAAGIDLPPTVDVLDVADAEAVPGLVGAFDRAAARRGVDPKGVQAWRDDPLYVGAAAVSCGWADACVGGSTRPTADVLRAAIAVIGLAPGACCVTSSFLMVLGDGRVMSFGDCAVVPEPTIDQLAEVAVATSSTHRRLTGAQARVALLSFSTKGSAEHATVTRVRRALDEVRRRAPDLAVDGELQADAALDEAVAEAKSAGSPVAGRANVLIFPSLEAGNIGYKLVQRLGQARALGPLLQGLAAPMNDLSRGCSAQDIGSIALASAILARGLG